MKGRVSSWAQPLVKVLVLQCLFSSVHLQRNISSCGPSINREGRGSIQEMFSFKTLILPSNKGVGCRGERSRRKSAPDKGTESQVLKQDLFFNWDTRKKIIYHSQKRSVLALQAKLQALFPYASCTVNSGSGSFQPFVWEQRQTMNISCVSFTCLQVPWKLLKCKHNNIIIYLSSSTCSLQRKEEKNTCAPIQSQCKRHALFLKSESKVLPQRGGLIMQVPQITF